MQNKAISCGPNILIVRLIDFLILVQFTNPFSPFRKNTVVQTVPVTTGLISPHSIMIAFAFPKKHGPFTNYLRAEVISNYNENEIFRFSLMFYGKMQN